MSLVADDRAQSIQVGAVLLFAVLIIAFSTYQAVIVPNENRRVEFEHNQEVQSQLSELRDAISATQDGGALRSTTVDLGTQYPSRALGLNPSPPSGTLRTVGTTDPLVNLTVRNATATGETGDFWNGDPRHYNTGAITYTPAYHNYDDAPTTGYEHSVLYNDFDADSLILANQSFIQGTTLSPVTINGSIERTSSTATAVDTRPLSSSDRTVTVWSESDSAPLTLNFSSRLSESRWESVLLGQEHVEDVTGFPSAAGGDYTAIRVELNATQEYELDLTKAGVGTGHGSEDSAYLTVLSGDGPPIEKGGHRQVVLQVRDAFNNPVSGVDVHGDVAGTSLGQETTDADGQVTFTFDTSDVAPRTHRLNFTMNDSAVLSTRPFDAHRPANVTTVVDVEPAADDGGGVAGEYRVDWRSPNEEAANTDEVLTSCGPESCTWNVGAAGDDTLVLNATLNETFPVFDGVDVEFAVSNDTVGSVSPANGTINDGYVTTEFTAEENGSVDVLASGNEDGDVIELSLENVRSSGLEYVDGSGSAARAGDESRVDFDVTNPGGDPVTIIGIRVESSEGDLASIEESNGGSGPGQHEVYIDSSDPGQLESFGSGYTLGTDATLDESATLSPGEEAQVTMLDFRNPGGNTVSAADAPLTVTLYTQNGASRTFSFTPPGY